ncbi:unnamed protein product [Dovyalis caffra]|uniref:Gnk2-homologous domain-containing protein n=1 Tax=Dovyalis caffra TaxID=77055 RepID=A0AAV1RFD9_9ROSI|nr:unnamed protein product [Dovyalis caffra]
MLTQAWILRSTISLSTVSRVYVSCVESRSLGWDTSQQSVDFSLSDPRATEAALICTNRTATVPERQTVIANFLAALDAVTPLVMRQKYAAVINGTGNTTVYAFGECMKDLDATDCNLCFAQCKTQILRCLPFQLATRGGRLFYDGCYLRYDDYNFFNETLSTQDKTICASRDFSGGNKTVFSANVLALVRNLSVLAPKNDGFFVGSVDRGNVSVFGLGQCWEFVNGSACETCLTNAVSEIGSCTPKEEGRVLNAGCYLRYSTHKFYNNSSSPSRGNKGEMGLLQFCFRLAIILAVTSSSLALALIAATAAFFVRRRVAEKKRVRKELGPESLLVYEYVPNQSLHDYFFGCYLISKCAKKKLPPLSWAMRLYEAIDPVLEGNFQEEEASRLLQIGLLCVQASPELRPSMSIIIRMINNNHEVPQPTQPPFLTPAGMEIRQPGSTYKSQLESCTQSSGNSMTQSLSEPR